ncbi:hypothetical protein B0H10DRAFT_1360500 [Mycena sp. CBHHK59/15]|nr:hypothetical protein B0H10DRAFT_1360500 [Mycena sp. CBHHK59/15]
MGKVDDHRGFVPLADASRNLPVSTHCSLTEMTIECPHIGQIVVKRSQGIRCIDVYRAIYHEYRERLRAHEIPENLARYTGMRRVDLLRGKRIFDGLTRSGADWELHIHYPE